MTSSFLFFGKEEVLYIQKLQNRLTYQKPKASYIILDFIHRNIYNYQCKRRYISCFMKLIPQREYAVLLRISQSRTVSKRISYAVIGKAVTVLLIVLEIRRRRKSPPKLNN